VNPVTTPPRQAMSRLWESELRTRIPKTIEDAREALGAEVVDLDGEVTSHPALAAELISTLTWQGIDRLENGAGLDPSETARICRLVVRLQQLGLELYDHQVAVLAKRIAACDASLSRLRAIPTSADLVDRVCAEFVRGCELERVLLSRVDDGMWRPWMAHSTDPSGHTEDWISSSATPLADMALEVSLVTQRKPALVRDAVNNPQANAVFVAGGTNSYVVAPIMPAGRIVGFLHADHYPSRRRVDDADREVIWKFAEGFGHIYERSVMIERLHIQRDKVRETLTATEGIMTELCDSEIELSRRPDPGSLVTRTAVSILSTLATPLDELTPREREVLALMVAGATNSQIADALIITVGTVKSHVKHILAKLGAVNRSQAIAIYLGAHDPEIA
jgi:DNA-binding CsgD family transcriptional regulator